MAYRETQKMRQRKLEVRQRILACGLSRVAEGGFRNARISEVAESAGVATGTIYRHFRSKEELFAELFRIATGREVERVAAALAGDGNAVERLERALRDFARRALRGPVMAWSLIAEPVDPRVEAERLSYRQAYARLFASAIDAGITEGSIAPQDARHSSTCLVGAIAESLVGPLAPVNAGPQPALSQAQQQALTDGMVRFCLQGLTGNRRHR